MAHEIDMTNDRANMAYVGDTPWHGLGQQLTCNASLDTWQKEAGMDWEINAADLSYTDHNGNLMTFPEKTVLFRSDNSKPLGVVSNTYQIVQPSQVMEFFRDMIEGHGFTMETAGCLFGGRKFWALARTGETFKVAGSDEVKPYLMMATSCDGTMATAVHFTSVRVVCNNTLRMSIGDNAQNAQIKVPHCTIFNADIVKSQLGISGEVWGNFVENVDKLAQFKLDRNDAIQVVADQLKKEEWIGREGQQLTTDDMLNSSRMLRRIINLYDGEGMGANMPSARGTGWGLVNAVTQYFDHEAGRVNNRSKAFERANFTDRAMLKTNVANELLKMAA